MINCFDCLRQPEKKPTFWWEDLWNDIRGYFIPQIMSKVRKIFPNKRNERFAAIIFPVIKNMTHAITVQDIIGIQPMNESAGQVFYLDFIHSKRRWWQYWKSKTYHYNK